MYESIGCHAKIWKEGGKKLAYRAGQPHLLNVSAT